ncbi:uncharacterized protein [Primulina eburnea]|uniref:uncharacterized protein n=1 Tax=Primulina eburnea TaxID=1245227 RepID=UPI003C6CAD96
MWALGKGSNLERADTVEEKKGAKKSEHTDDGTRRTDIEDAAGHGDTLSSLLNTFLIRLFNFTFLMNTKRFCINLDSSYWYFDSGSSRHMTGSREYLTDYVDQKGGRVTYGGGAKGKIVGKGTLNVEGLPKLHNVLHVEGINSYLISIRQLSKRLCYQGNNACLRVVVFGALFHFILFPIFLQPFPPKFLSFLVSYVVHLLLSYRLPYAHLFLPSSARLNLLCYSPSPRKAVFGVLKHRFPFCWGVEERNKFTLGLLHCISCVIIEKFQQIKPMAISSTQTIYRPLEEKCTTLANLNLDIRNWFVKVLVSEKTPIRFLKWGRQQKLVFIDKENGTMQGIIYDQDVEQLNKLLQLYKTYYVGNAKIKKITSNTPVFSYVKYQML